MNNYCGSGTVSTNPTVGKTATGVDYVKFIVSIERPKGKNGAAAFDRIPVGCWGPVCKYAQYIESGDEIEFQGSLSTASKKDAAGNWTNSFEIMVRQIKVTRKYNPLTAAPTQPQPMTPNPVPVPQRQTAVPMPTNPPPVIDPDTMPFDVYGGYYG